MKVQRLREIDFLRGIAISLVLFRHCHLFDFTDNMGWIGVDLFFVLSGFLVSGLLFREYKKHGDIKPSRFLIRRGFKIYPLYYLMSVLYLIPIFLYKDVSITALLADLAFVQNYVSGWGYAFESSWSLALEEHFYFGLALLLWVALETKKIDLTVTDEQRGMSQVEKIILSLMVFCLFLRVLNNLGFPNQLTMNPTLTNLQIARNFTMTHLRIDSLLAGVLISYLYQFRKERLLALTRGRTTFMIVIILAGLCWTPFISPVYSFFVKTIGFSLLYISFGLLLTLFITYERINERLDQLLSSAFVDIVSKIGFCSYSIYLVHPFVNMLFFDYVTKYVPINSYILFVVTSIISISLGFVMTNSIEGYFLGIRDKYYPNRSGKPVFEPTLVQ